MKVRSIEREIKKFIRNLKGNLETKYSLIEMDSQLLPIIIEKNFITFYERYHWNFVFINSNTNYNFHFLTDFGFLLVEEMKKLGYEINNIDDITIDGQYFTKVYTDTEFILKSEKSRLKNKK